MEKERLEAIINELIAELSAGAEPDYLEETIDNIFTPEEKEYFNL